MDTSTGMLDDREVLISVFPHQLGHAQIKTTLSTLTPEKVFVPPFHTVINGQVAKTWDDLLRIAVETPVTVPLDIKRFAPVIPG